MSGRGQQVARLMNVHQASRLVIARKCVSETCHLGRGASENDLGNNFILVEGSSVGNVSRKLSPSSRSLGKCSRKYFYLGRGDGSLDERSSSEPPGDHGHISRPPDFFLVSLILCYGGFNDWGFY